MTRTCELTGLTRARAWLRRLAADRSGMAAVEAAFVFPILVGMFLGLFELFEFMQVSDRVYTAADLTADLIAKQKDVSSPGVADTATVPSMTTIFSATKFMLAPFATSSTNPTIDAASILYSAPSSSANNLSTCGASTYCKGVDWEQTYQGASSSATATSFYQNFTTGCTKTNLTGCYCILDPSTLSNATPSCEANQSAVYVQVSLNYVNPVAWFLAKTPTLTHTAFLDPRLVFYVPLCTTTSSTSCK